MSDLERCQKALEIYATGRTTFNERPPSEESIKYAIKRIIRNANTLSQGSRCRIGAPLWPDAKLVFSQRPGKQTKSFWIDRNGMDKKSFQKWQDYIGKKFEENNLNFYYFE